MSPSLTPLPEAHVAVRAAVPISLATLDIQVPEHIAVSRVSPRAIRAFMSRKPVRLALFFGHMSAKSFFCKKKANPKSQKLQILFDNDNFFRWRKINDKETKFLKNKYFLWYLNNWCTKNFLVKKLLILFRSNIYLLVGDDVDAENFAVRMILSDMIPSLTSLSQSDITIGAAKSIWNAALDLHVPHHIAVPGVRSRTPWTLVPYEAQSLAFLLRQIAASLDRVKSSCNKKSRENW